MDAEALQTMAITVDALRRENAAQQIQINELTVKVNALQLANVPVLPAIEPVMPIPERFSGKRSDFRNFRNRCLSYFQMRPTSSGSVVQKITLLKTLLTGDSQTWIYNLPDDHEAFNSVEAFFEAMAVVYDDPDAAATAESKLKALRQGSMTVESYASEFRKWAVSSRWEGYALLDLFLTGLSDRVNYAMLDLPEPRTLEDAITLAIRVDRRIRYSRQSRSHPSPSPKPRPQSSQEAVEPMQIGHSKLSETEKLRRRREGLCLYCGEGGHVLKDCSKKPENSTA